MFLEIFKLSFSCPTNYIEFSSPGILYRSELPAIGILPLSTVCNFLEQQRCYDVSKNNNNTASNNIDAIGNCIISNSANKDLQNSNNTVNNGFNIYGNNNDTVCNINIGNNVNTTDGSNNQS
ncbi:hypothetical protein HELRODRAFT_166817 [Helobdella robusta]|uniref:Uncharacterized protein n=1 Tax=Helobdella robusta TaxID=6412 RepID=T1EYK2_HELRO|nr:hypothetical protein HELRODRAFT_166817 [Helobdella robusta]ESO11775.1 hypothetical protein HELRODRAFT_166817 [Helobdella robusta]